MTEEEERRLARIREKNIKFGTAYGIPGTPVRKVLEQLVLTGRMRSSPEFQHLEVREKGKSYPRDNFFLQANNAERRIADFAVLDEFAVGPETLGGFFRDGTIAGHELQKVFDNMPQWELAALEPKGRLRYKSKMANQPGDRKCRPPRK